MKSGEDYPHQEQQHEQHKPSEMCWCSGASNVKEVKWMQDFMGLFRPILREEVEEAMKRVFLPHLPSLQISTLPAISRSLPHQPETSASRRLYLRIDNVILPDTLYTVNKLQDQGASLKVELLDDSGSRVEDGPESSAKIKISVLDGKFEVEDRDDWTEEDFNKNVALPRDDKGPLLRGGCEISLSRGFASVGDFSFTDNSKSMRNGKFRLGAKVVKTCPGVVIREAVSKAIQVKERRLQSNGKHAKPSPDDELWRLVNISKDGAVYQRAVGANIRKVKDFLQLYRTDPKKLQNILRVPETRWKEIVKNAEACVYYDDTMGDHISQCYGSLGDFQNVYVVLTLILLLRCIVITWIKVYRVRPNLDLCCPLFLQELLQNPSMQTEQTSLCLPHSNIQHLDATGAAHQGGLIAHGNGYSPWPLLNTFQNDAEEASAHSNDHFDWTQYIDEQWYDSTPVPGEGPVDPTKNNATSKLIAACYVTKAATMFMISVKQDHGALKKKRRFQ